MNRIIKISDKVNLGIDSTYGKGLHLDYIQMFGIPYSISSLEKNNIKSLIRDFIRIELKYDIFANLQEYQPTEQEIKDFFKYFLYHINKYDIPPTLLDFNNVDELIHLLFNKTISEIDYYINYDNILDLESKIKISSSLYESKNESCFLSLIDCEIKNSYFKSILEYKKIKHIISMLYVLSHSKITSSGGVLESCLNNLFLYYNFINGKKSIKLYNKNGVIETYKNFSYISLLKDLVSDIRYLKHGKNRFHITSNCQQKLKELLN